MFALVSTAQRTRTAHNSGAPCGYRLISADYSTGDFYHYVYDSVGNRLSETTQLATKNYVYDDANRLASVDGVNYTFDDNGNLLNDGVNAYVYDSANRLISATTRNPTPTTDSVTGSRKMESTTPLTSMLA